MRILMCSPNPLVRELGAPKVLIELAEALREIGVTCDLAGPSEYGACPGATNLADRLRAHVCAHGSDYDVIDVDHEWLAYPRGDFDPRPLIVARSVLLVDHLKHVPLGVLRRLRGMRRAHDRFRRAEATLRAADLINVSNDDDKAALARRGHSTDKIVVLPFGLSAARRAAFESTCETSRPSNRAPRIAFVGTFDYRKGAPDFGELARAVGAAGASLRLLGTAGLFQTESEVTRFFPRELRPKIEVVPRFDTNELPTLLRDCDVGAFPSYYEGFGFGVLEMLAAAIPVIAYDAPGPPMMLPREWLVPPGDVRAMAAKVIGLMNPEHLAPARVRARELSRPFDWIDIARRTVRAYEDAVARRREHGARG